MRPAFLVLVAGGLVAAFFASPPYPSIPSHQVAVAVGGIPIPPLDPLRRGSPTVTTTVVPSTVTSAPPAPPQRKRPTAATTMRPHSAMNPAGGTLTSSSATWACIIARESGGNPKAYNRSSGASGLVQFMPRTWHSVTGLPGNAGDYPVEVQMAAAYKLQAEVGWSPWSGDGCVR